jgi:hypothetical protein
MTRTVHIALTALCMCALPACTPAPASDQAANAPKLAEPVTPVSVPEPAAAPSSAPAEHFGAPFAEAVPAVTLSALIADPAPHAGKIVETTGKVSQVCQAAGCWMELSDAGSGERVRTPMAGHAFFLPKTVVGKEARVQGRVELIALTDAMKKHLEAEGAQATGGTLSLSALSVSVQ